MPAMLVLAGLRREADCLAGLGAAVLVSGGRPAELRRQLDNWTEPVEIVVSFGLCGGLDPVLRPGDLVIPDAVVTLERSAICLAQRSLMASPPNHEAGSSAFLDRLGMSTTDGDSSKSQGAPGGATLTDRRLTEAAVEWARGAELIVRRGGVVSSDRVVSEVGEKQSLRRDTGAAIVDMESHLAAAFAAERGAGLLVMRAVADPAGRALPKLAAAAIDERGDIDGWRVAAGLLHRPVDLTRLFASWRDSSAALATLRRCRALLELFLRFGAADFG